MVAMTRRPSATTPGIVANRVGRVVANLFLEGDERARAQVTRERLVVEPSLTVGEEEHAAAFGGELIGAGADRIVGCSVDPHQLGRAEHPRAAVAERRR